jgi:phage FluMu gp28-like protein
VSDDAETELEELFARPGALANLASIHGTRIHLDVPQLEFLRDESRQIACVKARQVGYTAAVSLRGLERALVRDNWETAVSSYNREEATRVIRAAKSAYDSLPWHVIPKKYRRKLVQASATRLVWEDARGRSSIVAVAPGNFRGFGGENLDLVLDEFSYAPNDAEMLQAAGPATSRGGSITVLGTPAGARGMLWSLVEDPHGEHPDWSVHDVPWWRSRLLTKVRPCQRITDWIEANYYTTTVAERIALFGNAEALRQFKMLGSDEYRFAEEFETCFHDGAGAVFDYDLIVKCCDDLAVADDIDSLPPPTGVRLAGFDPGLTRDAGELLILDHSIEDDRSTVVLRKTMRKGDGYELHVQHAYLTRMMEGAGITRLRLDAQGLGREMGDELCRRFPDRVEPVYTSAATKAEQVVALRNRMAQKRIALPRADRDLHDQINSIRRVVTVHGTATYHGGRSGGRHHADAFWGLAAANVPVGWSGATECEVRMTVLGGDESYAATYVDEGALAKLYSSYDAFDDVRLQRALDRWSQQSGEEALAHLRAIEAELAARAFEDAHGHRPPANVDEHERRSREGRLFDLFSDREVA